MAKNQQAKAAPETMYHVYWLDPTADILRSSTFEAIEEVVTHLASLEHVEEIKVCRGVEINFAGVELSKKVKLGGKVYSID